MVESSDATFLTGVLPQVAPGELTGEEIPTQSAAIVEQKSEDSEEAFSSDGEGQEQNQYFHVEEAEPPTNYDDPYSTLPSKIKLQTIKVRKLDKITLWFIERYHLICDVPFRQ